MQLHETQYSVLTMRKWQCGERVYSSAPLHGVLVCTLIFSYVHDLLCVRRRQEIALGKVSSYTHVSFEEVSPV